VTEAPNLERGDFGHRPIQQPFQATRTGSALVFPKPLLSGSRASKGQFHVNKRKQLREKLTKNRREQAITPCEFAVTRRDRLPKLCEQKGTELRDPNAHASCKWVGGEPQNPRQSTPDLGDQSCETFTNTYREGG